VPKSELAQKQITSKWRDGVMRQLYIDGCEYTRRASLSSSALAVLGCGLVRILSAGWPTGMLSFPPCY